MPFFFGSGGNSVTVALENCICRDGSVLTGHAYVDIVTPTEFSGVFLKIKGKEKTKVIEHQTRYRTRTETVNGTTQTRTESYTVEVPHYGKRQIFKTIALLLPGGQMMRGQFSIPFTFQLPVGIPGSFALVGSDFSCSVEYATKVVVRVPGMLKSDLRHEVPLVVIQPPPPFTNQVTAHATADITVMCCFRRGHADLSFRAAKDAFHVGEFVLLSADVNNNSKSKLSRIAVKLRRTITVRANDGFTRSFEDTISESRYPGVPAFSSMNGLSMTLKIPDGTPQQCFSTLIQCMYSVRLAGKVRWGTDATCTVPALIYYPFMQSPVIPTFPAVWQPEIFQPIHLQLYSPVMIPPPVSLDMYPESSTMQPTAPPHEQSDDSMIPVQQSQAMNGASQ